MRRQHFTYTITRTTEIEVECTFYPDYDEVEIISATNCETGEPIELDAHETDEVNERGASEHVQGLKDAEEDNRYEDWKLERMERNR